MGIKTSINKGLSDSLKLAFPSVIASEKYTEVESKIPNPQWLAGFATGEGCFFIKNTKSSNSKQGVSIQLKFQLTQHYRDELLMRSLIDYFKSGNVFKNQDTYIFEVSKFACINSIIIPFFKEYPILGSKNRYFSDWVQVVELVNNKVHLTKEGLAARGLPIFFLSCFAR